MWVCRLPVHIGHAERAVFYETLRRIRDFPMGRQSRRPLRKGFNRFPYLVGADDSVRPAGCTVFAEIFGEFTRTKGAPWAQGELARRA